MATSSGGGYCDCGDVEAWKEAPFCEKHNINQQQEQTQVFVVLYFHTTRTCTCASTSICKRLSLGMHMNIELPNAITCSLAICVSFHKRTKWNVNDIFYIRVFRHNKQNGVAS